LPNPLNFTLYWMDEKQLSEKIKHIFLNRVALNLYFWIGFLFLPVFLSLGDYGHSEAHYEANFRAQASFAVFYAIIIYFNNLYLLPKFFVKGKYIIYFLILIVLISIWAILQAKYDYLFYGCNCLLPFTGNRFLVAGFQISCFVLGFAGAKIVRDYMQKEDKYREMDKIRLENELRFLRNQINPHFLFNTLNNLYAYALDNSPRVPGYILKLSEIIRYMLYESNEKFVSLEKELKYLESYIELQKVRIENRGAVHFEVKGVPDEQKIAPSLLISFVENSFKHSSSDSLKDIFVKIEVNIDDSKLFFKTENSISGGKEPSKGDDEGIGLKNVKKRLELLYPENHELKIERSDNTYTTYLTINLQKHELQMSDR